MAYYENMRYDLLNKIFPDLTPVQAQCVLMYSFGMSSLEISGCVGVSRQMIDKNLHAAAKKMNVNNLIALKPSVVIGILLEVLASLPVKDDLTNED